MKMNFDFAVVGGHRIRYAAARKPGASQMLMTSPQPMSVLTYRNMWGRLAERFDLVAVDLPNHGGSDAASDVVTVDQHGAFLGAILDHFELSHPHFVGPDIGTPAILRFMADNPGRIASVVGGDAGVISPVEGELIFRLLVNSRLFGVLFRSLGGRFYAKAANGIGFRKEQPPKEVLEDFSDGSIGPGKLRGQIGFLASYPSTVPRLMHAYPSIQTPVFVLHGEFDTFVAMSNSKRLSELLPNSKFAVIPDAAHYSWEDNVETYLQHILDWTAKVEAER
ncbi:haloalkane dehalogenase [Roseivivax jejudonensis]|uniref:Haloalkane dehalogenase n=1 Tax=Roseivivax jejudonensis TaxID=1529041 RepID=A0A1X6YN55_9RHOB|nr:alpha/beta hydrolase [Roseivivax jejudonensis]SLN25960.1 haloalkane dehalogenase [Roseivivax jejudonensis]